MFRWIIGSSLKFRFLVIAAAVAMVVFGTEQLRRMPVDVFPEFAPPQVEIQTDGWGMNALEIEEMITVPIENVLAGTPGVKYVRSQSVNGLSQIRLIFNQGVDLLSARQLVSERMKEAVAQLPQSLAFSIMLPAQSSTARILKIGLSSKVYNQMDLSMIAYWTIRFRLMSVPGVADIPMWGEQVKELQIQLDPELMRAHGLTVDEVMESASDSLDFGLLHYTTGGKARIDGMLDTPNQRIAIQYVSPVFGPEDLEKVVLKHRSGETLRIGDVAKVTWDTWPLVGDAVINDGAGLMLIVQKAPWANTLEVTRGIEKALAELKPGLTGIDIDSTIFRPATFIELSVDNLTTALIIGAIFVIFVLGAFLYEWRVALISVVALPLSLVSAGFVLYFMGATVNTMVLAGFVVALGSLVDDAIVDVENIVRRLRQHRRAGSDKSTARIVLEASLEIRSAIMYATIIIVLSVTPVFFLGGLSGAFFAPLAFSYVLAMLASMVVAMTVTPALCLLLLDKTAIEHRESPLVPWLKRHYAAMLSRVLKAPRTTYVTACVVALAGVVVWPLLGQGLLPSFKERDFLMHWLPRPDTSHPETFRITQAACRELLTIPGLRNCGSHIGRAIAGDEPYGVYFTENWVSVDPKVDYDKTLESINELVDGYPGLVRDVQTFLRERIKEVLTGAGESIVVRINGPELPVLRQTADDVVKALTGIPGLIDLHGEYQVEVPQIEIKVDLAKAARYGIKPGDVRRAVAVVTNGQEITDIHRDGKVYDVMVYAIPEARSNPDSIRGLLLDTPSSPGGKVRLDEVAEVKLSPVPNVIKRENATRRIDVHANVRGRDLGSVVRDVEARVEAMKFPVGYYPHILGEWQERQAATKGLKNYTIAVAIGIFLLLHAAFRNWRLAVLTFLALPAALVGGILAAYAGDGIISLGSLVGFLTVLGIAARNGILLISHYQHLGREEGEPFGIGLVLRGALERLSPILMTTLCTGLALLPLAVSGDIPGHEVEYPMAVVILGGLVTSTLLTLFLVPVLYLRFGSASMTDDVMDQRVKPAVTP